MYFIPFIQGEYYDVSTYGPLQYREIYLNYLSNDSVKLILVTKLLSLITVKIELFH